MSTVTEEVLRGDWFYLEEDAPFDPLQTTIYSLADGEARREGRVVGCYTAEDGIVSLDMEPTGSERRWTIMLTPSAGEALTASTPWLQADSTFEFTDQELWSIVGAFRRKTVDYVDIKAIRLL